MLDCCIQIILIMLQLCAVINGDDATSIAAIYNWFMNDFKT